MGYANTQHEGVTVNVDRTTPANFELRVEAVQGEEVTVTAEREVIQMDVSGSQTFVGGEEFVQAPVQTVVDYLSIQEGVELESGSQGTWLSIRGGGRDEQSFYVDGMSTMNAFTATPYMNVSRTAIREVQVQTGGFNAEYGQARSGVVNVVTRDGSRDQFSVALEGRYSFPHLKHFGPNMYDKRNPIYIAFEGENNAIDRNGGRHAVVAGPVIAVGLEVVA